MEYYYGNIFSYQPLGASHQGSIDYTKLISTRSTTTATPSGLPSTITPDQTLQTPQIITSAEESLSSQPPLPPSIYIDFIPLPLTKVPPTEPNDQTFHKNSLEPLSIHNINLVTRTLPIFLIFLLHQHRHHARIGHSLNH